MRRKHGLRLGRLPGLAMSEVLTAITLVYLGAVALFFIYKYLTTVQHLDTLHAGLVLLLMALVGNYSFVYCAWLISRSRNRVLARKLVKEKSALLRKIPYDSIRVSKVTKRDTNFSPPIIYDGQDYPPEKIVIGDTTFIRYSLVQMGYVRPKLEAVPGTATGASAAEPQYSSDMKLLVKQISVHVVWLDGGSWMQVGPQSRSER